MSFAIAQDGRLVARGPVKEIRNMLNIRKIPVKGRVTGEGLVFPASQAARVEAALMGQATTVGQAADQLEHNMTSKGTYEGAPPQFNTPRTIGKLRKRLNRYADEGGRFRFWYNRSGQLALELSGGDKEQAVQLVGLAAILSGNTEMAVNVTAALKAWFQHKSGRPIKAGRYGHQDRAAAEWLKTGKLPESLKVGNFILNLAQTIDPDFGGQAGTTVDLWVMRAMGFTSKAAMNNPGPLRQRFANIEINRIAKDRGWSPEQAQAAIWVAVVARMEAVRAKTVTASLKAGDLKPVRNKAGQSVLVQTSPEADVRHNRRWTKNALAHSLTDAELEQAGRDFSDMWSLEKYRANLSHEAIPGTDSGVLPGIHNATWEQKLEFQEAVNAIWDDAGYDGVARLMKLPWLGAVTAPGYWEGVVNPSRQGAFLVAPLHKRGKEDVHLLDPGAIGALEAYAAIKGQIMHQDMMGYHFPGFGDSQVRANGVFLHLGRPLTEQEMAALGNELTSRIEEAAEAVRAEGKEGGFVPSMGSLAPVSNANGINIFQLPIFADKDTEVEIGGEVQKIAKDDIMLEPYEYYSKGEKKVRPATAYAIPNKQFHKIVKEAVLAAMPDADVGVRYFRTDGGMVEKGAEGANYERTITDRGYRQAAERAYAVYGPRWLAVAREFSEKYGWGEARLAPAVQAAVDRAESGRVGEPRRTKPTGRVSPEPTARGPPEGLPEGTISAEQKAEAAAHLVEPAKRFLRAVARMDGTVHVKEFVERFVQQEGAMLVGQKVEGPADLAAISQLLRSPMFETLRFFLVNDEGTILHHSAVSTRMPDSVDVTHMGGAEGYANAILEAAKATGATGYYLMHNHPSGMPTPSEADWRFTDFLFKHIAEHSDVGPGAAPAYMGHVVLNDKEFGLLHKKAPGARLIAETLPLSEEALATPDRYEVRGAERTYSIEGPSDVAQIGRRMVKEDGVVLIGRAKENVGFIAEYPQAVFDQNPMRLLAHVREVARLTGSQDLFLTNVQPDNLWASIALLSGDILDAITPWGTSLTDNAGMARRAARFMEKAGLIESGVRNVPTAEWVLPRRRIYTVREPGSLYDGDQIGPGVLENLRPFAEQLQESFGEVPLENFREIIRGLYGAEASNDAAQVLSELGMGGRSPMPLSSETSQEGMSGAGAQVSPESLRTTSPETAITSSPNLPVRQYGAEVSMPFGQPRPAEVASQDYTANRARVNDAIEAGDRVAMDQAALDQAANEADLLAQGWNHARTPEGITMLPPGQSGGQPVSAVRGWVRDFPTGGLAVQVHADHRSAPAEIQAEMGFDPTGEGHQSLPVEAAYDVDTGTVHVFANMIPDEQTLHKVMVEEVFGHAGLRALLGDRLDPFLADLNIPMANLLPIAARYGLDLNTAEGLRTAKEEFLAQISPEHGDLWQRFVAWLRDTLRGLGLNLEMTERDAAHLMARAREAILHGEAPRPSFRGDIRFSVKNPAVSRSERAMEIVERVTAPSWYDLTPGERMREIRRGIDERFDDWNWKFKQGFLDSGASIERLEKMVRDGELAEGADSPWRAFHLSRNLNNVMSAVIKFGIPVRSEEGWFDINPDPTTKGLADIFRPLTENGGNQNMMKLAEGYMIGLRAQELIGQTNPDGSPREKLLTREEIAELVALGEEYPILKQVAKDYQEFNNALLDLAVDVGLLSNDVVDLWKQNFYVPFYRLFDEAEGPGGPGMSMRPEVRHSGIKRLRGSERRLDSILDNIVLNTANLVDKIYKHESMKRIRDLAMEAEVMEELPPSFRPVRVTVEQLAGALRRAGMLTGRLDPEMTARLEQLTDEELDRAYIGVIEKMSPEERASYETLFEMVVPPGPDVVGVIEQGRTKYYRVTDPLLLRTIKGMGAENFGNFMRLMRGFKTTLTQLVTADPGFMAANWMRDTLFSWVRFGNINYTPVVDGVKAWKDIWQAGRDSVYSRVMMAGGSGGGFWDVHGGSLTRTMQHQSGANALSTPAAMYRFWRRFGHLSEQSNRVALATAVLRDGGTISHAAHQAQDVTNFTSHGDWRAMRVLTQTVPFLNARIQGLYTLYRGAKENPGKFFMRGMAVTAATLAILARNWDRPEYEELPDWQKDIYWHVWVGGHHFALPKPFEAGVIFGSFPERVVRAAAGRDQWWRDFTKTYLLTTVGETFALNPVPQMFKPWLEQWANKQYFGGKAIIPMYQQGLEPEAQYRPWTSTTARLFAEAMPRGAPSWLRSPDRVEHLVRGYFGTIGLYMLHGADVFTREWGDFPPAPEKKIYDLRPIRRFYRTGMVPGSRYEDVMWEGLNEANAAFRTINAYAKQGRGEDALKLMNARQKELAQRQGLNQVATQVRKLNEAQRMLMYSLIDPVEKRERLDEIQRQKV